LEGEGEEEGAPISNNTSYILNLPLGVFKELNVIIFLVLFLYFYEFEIQIS
jgi:hypothetical protein